MKCRNIERLLIEREWIGQDEKRETYREIETQKSRSYTHTEMERDTVKGTRYKA